MAKRTKSTPTNILAAREAEAQRRAALAATAPPTPAEGPQVEQGTTDTGQEVIPYTVADLFAALGEANWNGQLLQRQNQILRQQVATYRNVVAELEAKLKVASGAPA